MLMVVMDRFRCSVVVMKEEQHFRVSVREGMKFAIIRTTKGTRRVWRMKRDYQNPKATEAFEKKPHLDRTW